MDDLCREDGQKVYDRKDCCLVSRQQKLRFLWYNFVFEQTTYEPPYMVSPDCLWRVDCQIVSVLTFLTGVSAKMKPGFMWKATQLR